MLRAGNAFSIWGMKLELTQPVLIGLKRNISQALLLSLVQGSSLQLAARGLFRLVSRREEIARRHPVLPSAERALQHEHCRRGRRLSSR